MLNINILTDVSILFVTLKETGCIFYLFSSQIYILVNQNVGPT